MNIKALLQKGLWVLLARSLGAGLAFLMIILFARWLGVVDFGLFSLGLTVMTILAVLARWGTDQVLLKQVGAHRKNSPDVARGYIIASIKLVSIFSVLIAFLVALFHEYIASHIFNKPSFSEILFYFGIIVIPYAINYSLTEAYKGLERPILSSYLQTVIAPLLTIILGYVAFTYLDFSLFYSVVIFGISITFALICSAYFWKKNVPSLVMSRIDLESLFKEGWPMLLVSSGALIMAWSDMVILGVWGSELELGLYAAASKTVLITSIVLVAMNSITAPKYAKLYQSGSFQELAHLAQNSSKILFFIVLIPTAILLFIPDWIMSWFGEEFIIGSTILMVLTVGQFINVICGSVGYILTMTGNEVKMRNIMLVTALINVVLSIVLVQFFGVIGVALGTTCSIILWNIWAMVEVKKQLGFWTVSF